MSSTLLKCWQSLHFIIKEIPPRSEKRKFKEIEKFISIIELLSFLFSVTAEFKKIKKFNNVHITRITNTLNHSGNQEIEKFNSNIEFVSSLLSITSEFKEIKKFNSNISYAKLQVTTNCRWSQRNGTEH